MAGTIVWTDIQARLAAAAITAQGNVLPIAWPNTNFKPPAPVSGQGNRPWLSVQIAGGSSLPIELGGSIWQDEGQVWVHILVPLGGGISDAMLIVDQVQAMFRSPPLEPVVYTSISADPGEPGTDDGAWWRTSVSADWRIQTYVPRS